MRHEIRSEIETEAPPDAVRAQVEAMNAALRRRALSAQPER